MSLLDHFSVYQNLPIRIDDVAGYVVECGYVGRVQFVVNEDDGRAIGGMLYHVEYSAPYDSRTVAYICYNHLISEEEQRLICAKELVHVADSDEVKVASSESVDKLIREMLIPEDLLRDLAGLGMETLSDKAGVLRALAILFPIEARDMLVPAYREGKIQIEQIARLVDLPIKYTAFVMSDVWEHIYKTIETTWVAFCKR